jgi:hypothetical protein
VAAAADRAMEERATSLSWARLEVLAERYDLEEGSWSGRSQREAPEVDGEIRFTTRAELRVGNYVPVVITGNEGADLLGKHES